MHQQPAPWSLVKVEGEDVRSYLSRQNLGVSLPPKWSTSPANLVPRVNVNPTRGSRRRKAGDGLLCRPLLHINAENIMSSTIYLLQWGWMKEMEGMKKEGSVAVE